ncbi:MAG: FAD binding domain-containing protein [Elusimicrobia bacterium]|nr:FAD binding domain-containing protein [Elusimicrobiota bacterium]
MEYFSPKKPEEAEKIKNRQGKKNVYLAGGTILNWKSCPSADTLIDLKNLGLDRISVSGGRINIGATVTVQEIADYPGTPGPLARAARTFTGRNIRGSATIGGTVAGGFFVSNLLPVLIAYGAELEICLNGRRKKTGLREWLDKRKGLVCAVTIKPGSRNVFVECEKISAIDFPLIVTAAGFGLKNGKISDPVIAVSGAAARIAVIRVSGAIEGRKPGEIDREFLNESVQKDLRVTDNVKASADIKRRIIKEHICRIMDEASCL